MNTPVKVEQLSPRELQLVEMASHGLVDKEIAARLNLSLATIRTYWERIRTKLGASNRAEAMARAAGSAGPHAVHAPERSLIGVVGVRHDRTVSFADAACEPIFGTEATALRDRAIASLVSERFQAFHLRLRALLKPEIETAGSPTFSVFAKSASGLAVPVSVTLQRVEIEGAQMVLCVIRCRQGDLGGISAAVVEVQ